MCKNATKYVARPDLHFLSVDGQCEISAVELAEHSLVMLEIYRTRLRDFHTFLKIFGTLLLLM